MLTVAALGGGGITALVAILLRYRSENAATYATATKTDAEAEATVSASVQRRYDSLFDDLEQEIARLRKGEEDCRLRLLGTMEELGHLRAEATRATAEVHLARAEISRLQSRLDALEAQT